MFPDPEDGNLVPKHVEVGTLMSKSVGVGTDMLRFVIYFIIFQLVHLVGFTK